MNPKESAAFIAGLAVDVKINPVGIKKVASEVLHCLYFYNNFQLL